MNIPELIEIYLSKVRNYIDDHNFVFELQDRLNLTNLGIDIYIGSKGGKLLFAGILLVIGTVLF